jgi:hypothetical protein
MRFRLVFAALLVPGMLTAQSRWFRGNTHAHTLNSDGDSPPDAVARWYRTHGYQFTFITDHEYNTDADALTRMVGGPGRFLVLPAQEVTQRTADATHPDGVRQAHVNALGVRTLVRPMGERNIANTTIAATYARNIAAIRAAGGVPQVNHPNFRWSVQLADMLDLPDSTMFELWNGHPDVFNLGGADTLGRAALSTEALWDSLLTRGKLLFAVADDDSHSFKPEDADNPNLTRPGRGWVMVRADTLELGAILTSLRRGDFYASTGVTLKRYDATTTAIDVEIAPTGDIRYLVEFVGSGGRVLAKSTTHRGHYDITGSEGYVRVRISDSAGRRAWTQPVMLRR